MYEICSAVAHLHKMNIAHRDIKPENLLYVLVAFTVFSSFSKGRIFIKGSAKTRFCSLSDWLSFSVIRSLRILWCVSETTRQMLV